jgi:eukaryotic-like serine/threonine-protein kinase
MGVVETKKAKQLEDTVVLQGQAGPPPELLPTPAPGPSDQILTPGTHFEHYVIEREVGTGGMGIVYKANDTLLSRTVALKVLPPHLCERREFLHRFAREARLLARIQSPYVVTVHTLMDKGVGMVLVMEHLDGETLEQRLRRSGPLSVKEAVHIFDEAARGVEHIHQMGIVHQDLKPANIFLTADGHVKLLDFGVSKLLDEQDFDQAGTMLGTLLYISPEQIKGRQVDQRSDIYTLGITLFEAVTGRLPFERKTNYALMHAHVQESPPTPRQYHAEIPRELEKVILKAIAKEPQRRFQTIREFRRALLHHRRTRLAGRKPASASLLASPADTGTASTLVLVPCRQPRNRRGILGNLLFDAMALAGIIALSILLMWAPFRGPTAGVAGTKAQASVDKYASLKKFWGNPPH